MRSRWQEWVIVVAIVALGGVGVAAIWGKDIKHLFRPESDEPKPQERPEAPAVPPPPGPVQGPI
jgi:hypothetical protein